MDFDGSKAKATLVEFSDFVALLELPISDQGGDATSLDDHAEAGRRALQAIARRFPAKPLRYVLSSHWHPHSLSALGPLFEANVTLVTTRSNLDRLKTMLPATAAPPPPSLVKLVEGEGMRIGDATNAIVVHRFTQKEYPSAPTEDYLYFQLPKYDALHVACMYARWAGPKVQGRELITGRERDLFRLIAARGIAATRLIRLDREKDGAELLPYADLAAVIRTGISSEELAAPFEKQTVAELRANRPRLVSEALKSGMPASILNPLVYARLGKRDLPRALEYATLQALIAPADANSWDTLGEIHYALGDADAARAYDTLCKRLGLTTAGERVWQRDLEELRKKWETDAPAAAR